MQMLPLVLGMAPPPGGDGQTQQSPMFMFGWIAIMFAIFYMMIIRPQRRREKDRQDLLKAVKSGDRILFGGGIIAIVTNVKERTIVVKVADKVKMEILRSAVNQVLKADELPADVDVEGNR